MNLPARTKPILLLCFVLAAVTDPAWGARNSETLESPLILTEQATLRPSDGTPGDLFGLFVAMSGDTVVIGAPTQNYLPGDNSGAAYVFVRSGSGWSEQARLRPSSLSVMSFYGSSVAISGDTVLVGGMSRAYVFVRTGSTWSEQAELLPLGGGMIGTAVAISGDTAVASDTSNGWVHLFVRSGSSWSEQASLPSPEPWGSGFGSSLAISGDTLVVGASAADGQKGAVYVYLRSGSTWSQQARLVADDGEPGDNFGRSLSLSGERIAVGARPQEGPGAVFTFVRSGSSWQQEARLLSAGGEPIGTSVAISGDLLVTGAPIYPGAVGSAHVFAHRGPAWSEQMVLLPSKETPGDSFGPTVALSGTTVVVGKQTGLENSGSAHVFSLDEFTAVAPAEGLLTTEDGGRATFTVALKIPPVGEVVIDLASTNTDEGTVSPTQLTFTPDDWSTAQTVTLTGVEDFADDDGQLYTVALTMNTELTEDPIYDGIDPPDVSAVNLPFEGDFYTVTPCRVLDTRLPDQEPALASGLERAVTFHGACGVPETARAVALSITVVDATSGGQLTLYPSDLPRPGLGTLAFAAGQVRSCNTIVLLAAGGAGTLTGWPLLDLGGSVGLVIDVSGYFE